MLCYREQVDLRFYNPPRNGSTINLTDIPVLQEKNLNGEKVSKLEPVNFGSIELKSKENKTVASWKHPPIPLLETSEETSSDKSSLEELPPLTDIYIRDD